MTTTCIKTGAYVTLDQYGEWAYCDAFLCADVLILRIVSRSRGKLDRAPHIIVHNADCWFNKEDKTSTLVTNEFTLSEDLITSLKLYGVL